MIQRLLLATSTALLFSSCAVQAAEPTHAHFTLEMVTTFPVGIGHQEEVVCSSEEVLVLNYFLADLIEKDTGFKDPIKQKYLPGLYKGQHPGFDFTYDCPLEEESCHDNEWCKLLCKGEDHHKYHSGHDILDDLGVLLKKQVHQSSKGLSGPLNVECLGIGSELVIHLRVAVSPWVDNNYYKST